MNYREATEYVKQIQVGAKIKPGLEVTGKLMQLLGDPQAGLTFVHVAGTNGKGSTAAFISSIYAAAGWKVGRFVSPAVFSERESIQYEQDGKTVYITEEEMARHLTAIRAAIEKMARCGDGVPADGVAADGVPADGVAADGVLVDGVAGDGVPGDGIPTDGVPTEFEIETAAAFLAFADWKCDIVVLETGMGGRLDATNIITTTACAVIAPVAMDHMKFLGDTIGQIACEKAGIIKEHVPVVMCQHDREAADCIARTCREHGCEWREVVPENIHIRESTLSGTRFDYKQYRDLRISVPGLYQVENACLAIECVEMLCALEESSSTQQALLEEHSSLVEHSSLEQHFSLARRFSSVQRFTLSEDVIRRGLAAARWRGRFEVISEKPCVVVDGAHNPDGMNGFLNSVHSYFGKEEKIAVMGVFADKDYREMAGMIGRTFSHIYTVAPPSERALAAEELASELNACARRGTGEMDGEDARREVAGTGAVNAERGGTGTEMVNEEREAAGMEVVNVERALYRAVACGTLAEAFDRAKQHREAVIFVFGSLSLLKGAYDYWG